MKNIEVSENYDRYTHYLFNKVDMIKDLVTDINDGVDNRPDELKNLPGAPDTNKAGYYQLLYDVASVFKPDIMVELGTHSGRGAACLARGNPNGFVYTVDIESAHVCGYARALKNITFIVGDSIHVANKIPDNINLVFFDSEHTYDRLTSEYQTYLPKCLSGAILLFDDLIHGALTEDMQRAFSEVAEPKSLLDVHCNPVGEPGFGVAIV